MMSRKAKYLALTFFAFVCLASVAADNLYLSRWEYMTAAQAEEKFGKTPFTVETFRKASVTERGTMAASLLRSKYGIGKDKTQIKEVLGPYSGFFWNESLPVYIVHEKSAPEDKIWQLVFIPGNDGKITEVRIQNNKPPDPLFNN